MSLEHPLIIMVLVETNHLNIQELGRMRAISRSHKAIIDRHWPTIVRKFLNSIGTSDINYAANLVLRNSDLLLQVLAKRSLRTGFVLNNDGKNLLLLLIDQNSKARQMLINEIKTDDKFAVLQAASQGDINTYKQMHYAKRSTQMQIMATDNNMQLIFRHYFRGLLLSNTKDYQINWNKVNEWDKTQFYSFIKPGLYACDMIVLIDTFHQLSQETQTREKSNIVAFIKRNIQPHIDYEKDLLRKVLTHSLAELPRMYRSTPHKTQTEKRIVSESLIRRLVTAAAFVDANLAIEYFQLAHELFDLTNDFALQDLAEAIIRSKTYEIIPVYTQWYKFPLNLFSLLLALSNKIDVSNITFESAVSTMALIKTKIGLLQGINPDKLDQMYGQLYQLENHEGGFPLYIQIAALSLDLSLLMSTKTCMDLYAKLPAGGRSYDLFINRDLEFWKYYIREVLELSYDGDIFQPIPGDPVIYTDPSATLPVNNPGDTLPPDAALPDLSAYLDDPGTMLPADEPGAALPDLSAYLNDAYPHVDDAYPNELVGRQPFYNNRVHRVHKKSNPLFGLLQYHIALYSIDVVRYILYLLPLNELALLRNNGIESMWVDTLKDEVSTARGLKKVKYSKEVLDQDDFWEEAPY